MASPANSATAPPFDRGWKRLVIRSLLGGTTCGVVLVLALGCLYFYAQRPKPWNQKALRAAQVKAHPLYDFVQKNDKLEAGSYGFSLTVNLENATNRDITIPESVTVMQEAKDSHALHDSRLRLRGDSFIPAGHTVTLSIETGTDLCAPNEDEKDCFKSYFQEDDSIVLFDNPAKYEIRIPVPTLTPLFSAPPKPTTQ